ncbi:MAG: divergent polysaccharide deacetylase family protein [Aquisalinus sp.]|nr:divergent polysaccharide deacetylase family protein [Aquisalinus sp.]
MKETPRKFHSDHPATRKMRNLFKSLRKTTRRISNLSRPVVYGLALFVGGITGAVLAQSSGLGGQLLATPVLEDASRPMGASTKLPETLAPLGTLEGQVATNPAGPLLLSGKPKIVVIFDDIGLNQSAYESLRTLPGPLTFSILPYVNDPDNLASDALARGHDVFLHLPMQPASEEEGAGPGALLVSDTPGTIRRKINRNLNAFSGYSGVNNHMGSLFTRDRARMKIVLSELDQRGFYFVDSLTSGGSVAGEVAAQLGMSILSRDVFLDSDYQNLSERVIRERLGELESIARNKGYAVAIAHPYKKTIDTIRPWLVSLEMRGFELVTVTELLGEEEEPQTLTSVSLR